MSDDNGAERYRDFYKFIATVDAAGLIGTLTLRRDVELDVVFGVALVLFGLSAHLCIIGMWLLTWRGHSEDPRLEELEVKVNNRLGFVIFGLTTIGILVVLLSAFWGNDPSSFSFRE